MTKNRFTHYVSPDGKSVELLVGDVASCGRCLQPLFRDHAFIADGEDPDCEGEPESVAGQEARGRFRIANSAQRVDEGDQYCESCSIDLGIL